ncbi:MAG: hypothetical protein KGI28_03075 [Thaumarchaeota archaeon]|nr:hypothetical protein [Nitrososphaerota archaeon]
MTLSNALLEKIRTAILDEVKDSQDTKPVFSDLVQKDVIKSGQAQTLFYAHVVGQMVTMAYSRASWTRKKPLDQEEKDQIFDLVDAIRTEIRVT